MAITQAMTTSFKIDILSGYHNFGTAPTRATSAADTFRLALFTSSATLDATTTSYTGTVGSVLMAGEVSNSGTNYTAGGNALTISSTPTNGGSGTTAFVDFSDVTFPSSTITARGALIFNTTQANKSVAVLDFGSDKTSTGGSFTIQFPTPDSTSAIIRIV